MKLLIARICMWISRRMIASSERAAQRRLRKAESVK